MDTRSVIDVMLDNPNVDSFVSEKEERIDALEARLALKETLILGLGNELRKLRAEPEPHEEVLLRDACGLERVMLVRRGIHRLRLPLTSTLWEVLADAAPHHLENQIRDFDFRYGRLDAQGRRILEEVL